MRKNWESSLKEGLELKEKKYYEILNFEEDPLPTIPVTKEEKMINFEKEVNNLLKLIGLAGYSSFQIIPSIGLEGGGNTSLINVVSDIIESFEESEHKSVSSFAENINVELLNAKEFLYSFEEVDNKKNHEKDYFTELIERIDSEKKTHIFIDNCRILRRYSVFPYLEAIIERTDSPFIFVLVFTPSSYNRFLKDFANSEFDESVFVGENIIRPMDDDDIQKILEKRMGCIFDFIDKEAFDLIIDKSFGTPKTAIEILRACMRELIIQNTNEISQNMVKKVCQRKNILTKKEINKNLTDKQHDILRNMMELGDFVTANELAQDVGLNRSSIVRMFTRLYEKGYLNKYKKGKRKIYYMQSSIKRYVEYEEIIYNYLDKRGEDFG